jgi:hypothetical protein
MLINIQVLVGETNEQMDDITPRRRRKRWQTDNIFIPTANPATVSPPSVNAQSNERRTSISRGGMAWSIPAAEGAQQKHVVVEEKVNEDKPQPAPHEMGRILRTSSAKMLLG